MKAIQLDPKFERAYAARAEVYLELKQDTLAIKDFDKVLNPDNTTAPSDRGLANLEIGQYYSAISDFDDAIRLKQEGDIYLPNLTKIEPMRMSRYKITGGQSKTTAPRLNCELELK